MIVGIAMSFIPSGEREGCKMFNSSEYRIDYREGDIFVGIGDDDGGKVVISVFVLPRLVDDLLRVLYPNLPLREDHKMAVLDADVGALAQLGKEWVKPAKRGRRAINRIYFDPVHGWYGLLIDGDRNATFRGQACTREEAKAIIARLAGAKVYFDEMTNTFYGVGIGREDFEFVVKQIRVLERGLPDDPV